MAVTFQYYNIVRRACERGKVDRHTIGRGERGLCRVAQQGKWKVFRRGKDVQRILIVLGVLMVAAGIAWPLLRKLPFGRLPGDIHIVREGVSFHFPIVTCIVISIVVSLLLWIFRR